MSRLLKTILGLILISVIIFFTGHYLFNNVLSPYYFKLFPYLVLSFFLINTGFFIFFFYSLNKSNAQFTRNFMASTVIKTMIYLIFVLVYVMIRPLYAIPFAITLLIMHFIYTAFDLLIMLSVMKRKKEKKYPPNLMSS